MPHVYKGRLVIGPVSIGDKCLIGNNACLPINSTIHNGTVLGVLSGN